MLGSISRTPKPAFDRHDYEFMEILESRQLLDGSIAPDRFENNDTPAVVRQSPVAGVNSPNLGRISGQNVYRNLTLEDGADFYRFRLLAPGESTHFARINFGNTRGNLDLKLVGPGGAAVLAQSIGNRGIERISLDGFSPGWYFIKVEGKNGATSPTYRLTLNTPAANPNDDLYENNDTLEQVMAKAAGQNSPNLGVISANRTLGNLKLNDTFDIFKFRFNFAPSTISFVRVNSTTPLDMVLFNAQGQSVRSSEAYLGQNSISLAGLPLGDYYVQVSHYALGTPGTFNYSLTWQV